MCSSDLTLLAAKPAAAGVEMFTYTATLDNLTTREHVIFGDIEGTIAPFAMGGRTVANYTISCVSMLHQPAADDAADRAWAILNAVAEVLASDWTISGNVLDANLASFTISEGVKDQGGRRVDVEFVIAVEDTNV